VVAVRRGAERLGRVQDRPVAGAAAQVAGERVVVEHPGLAPAGAVVLRRHAADEARGAVAALRPAAHRHLLLHGVQGVRVAETLRGHQLLAGERRGRHQARVDRRPLGRGIDTGTGEQHRAGTALALGAAFLGARQPDAAQPVERGRRRRGAGQAARLAVDGDQGLMRRRAHGAHRTSRRSARHPDRAVRPERVGGSPRRAGP
jgi:hypothetical protein